jgi:hypothetical protein
LYGSLGSSNAIVLNKETRTNEASFVFGLLYGIHNLQTVTSMEIIEHCSKQKKKRYNTVMTKVMILISCETGPKASIAKRQV